MPGNNSHLYLYNKKKVTGVIVNEYNQQNKGKKEWTTKKQNKGKKEWTTKNIVDFCPCSFVPGVNMTNHY